MKKIITGFLVVAVGIALWKFLPKDQDTPPSAKPLREVAPVTPAESNPPPAKGPVQVGNQLLADYGSEKTTAKEDLENLGTLVENVFLLVKSRDSAQYATNEDLAAFLLGKNDYQEAYVSPDAAVFKEGTLVDRWGSPIIVHPVSHNLLEIKSAGPDQKPYTADDLHWPPPMR